MRALAVLFVSAAIVGCSSEGAPLARDGGMGTDDAPFSPVDGGSLLADAPSGLDGASPSGATAPEGTVPGEVPAGDTEPTDATPSTPFVARIEAGPNEHITFFLTFTEGASVELEVLRWDGTAAVSLGTTDAGPGLRTLAVFDPTGPRTFWARVTTSDPAFTGTLTITRVPFADGATCPGDCARLLQLPLPNDPAIDGYDHTSSTVFRYQYGRRDLVMFLRHAGQRMIALGHAPFVPEDLSQWDGLTPGTDRGAPRHASHQRGKDVDISLYGDDGLSIWRSYCEAVATADGRECVAGSEHDFDGTANAIFFGDFLATGRVTMSFLDVELHPPLFAGAETATAAGLVDDTVLPFFSDGVHVQHWPNHDNHIHIRVSEVEGSAFFADLEPVAFEPP